MKEHGHLILPFELGPNRTVWDEEELYKWIEKEKTNLRLEINSTKTQ